MLGGFGGGKLSGPGSFKQDFFKTLVEITGLLQKAQIPYMVIGAMALTIWGRPRTTIDLDFKVLADPEELQKLQSRAAKKGYRIDHEWQRYNPLLVGLQTRMLRRGIPIDLLVPRDRHDRQAFLRRKRMRLGQKYFWFSAAEDLILEKLKVGRPRDFEDAVTVLERMGEKLDMRYLRRWAKKLGLQNELDYILGL